VCYKQFVSPPLLGAQSVTGTVSWAVWGTDSAADTASVVDIRVIQSDGTTVRGVALTRTVGSGNFTSAGRTDFANAIAITTVSAQHGDFIVIEMGAKSLTSNNRTPILTFGGSGGSDYGYTATDTTSGKNPSVQLSATLAFQVGANSLMLMGCGT
jgi:D-serine deaminase-like pyridoxal phosphate-dependent protein